MKLIISLIFVLSSNLGFASDNQNIITVNFRDRTNINFDCFGADDDYSRVKLKSLPRRAAEGVATPFLAMGTFDAFKGFSQTKGDVRYHDRGIILYAGERPLARFFANRFSLNSLCDFAMHLNRKVTEFESNGAVVEINMLPEIVDSNYMFKVVSDETTRIEKPKKGTSKK